MSWLVMKTPEGYRVGRLTSGAVQYQAGADGQPRLIASRQLAKRTAERLNVSMLPARCTPQELDAMVRGLRIMDKTMLALRLLLIEGHTWRQASCQSGVSQSGILRALRKITATSQQAASGPRD